MADNHIKTIYIFGQAVGIFLVGLLFHYAAASHYGIAVPTIHDEFAYLLSADTFSQGRLANPTHPLWEHFQTFHVFLHPTYQAKYPPFQGLFLALGKSLFGAPIWGVWISLALAYAATYWLFLSSIKPSYAMIGTLIVMINPFIAVHWGHTYWGGAVAMLGGALFLGGVRHSRRKITLGNSLLMGIGLFILANSRPFEGFVVTLLALPIVVRITRQGSGEDGMRKMLRDFILPLGVVCAVLIVWMLYYNAVLTGDPLKYQYFNWDKKAITIDMIKNYQGSPPLTFAMKIGRLWSFFIGPFLSLAIVGLFFILMRKEMIFESICIIVVVLMSIIRSQAWPHYLAPVAGLLYLLVFLGLYEIRNIAWLKDKKLSATLFAIVMAVHFTNAAFGTYALFNKGPARPFIGKLHSREDITRKLKSEKGKDLILVNYEKNHNIHEEFVYNRADIDAAEIVWARNLGKEKNQRLFEYFKDRNIWMLLPDRKPMGFFKLHEAGADIKSLEATSR